MIVWRYCRSYAQLTTMWKKEAVIRHVSLINTRDSDSRPLKAELDPFVQMPQKIEERPTNTDRKRLFEQRFKTPATDMSQYTVVE